MDDNEQEQGILCNALTDILSASSLSAELSVFKSAEQLLEIIKPGMFSIIFLDIYMSGKTGMEAAREVYRTDPHCRLVFFTTSSQHAIESYDVRARYYLQKPLDRVRLEQAMEVCLKGLTDDIRYLTVRINRIPIKILYRDIFYISSRGRCSEIHLADRTVGISESFGEINEMLADDGRFYLCNKGILVNLDKVDRPDGEFFILQNGTSLPIRQKGSTMARRVFLSRCFPEVTGEERVCKE